MICDVLMLMTQPSTVVDVFTWLLMLNMQRVRLAVSDMVHDMTCEC